MQKSVPNVPSHEEFFGLDDNLIEDYEFEASDEEDEKIKKMLIVMLGLLQEFYIDHMYDESYFFTTEQFTEELEQLNELLTDNLTILLNDYVKILLEEQDLEWKLPSQTVNIDLDLEKLIITSVTAVIDTLKTDLIDKAQFYQSFADTTGKFSPHANFRRAIKKLTNEIKFKGTHIQKVIERKYIEFAYGQEALFYWKCSGINTCAWCYSIEAMGALPLSMFPVDHVNGRCWLEPAFPDEYSNDYLNIRL